MEGSPSSRDRLGALDAFDHAMRYVEIPVGCQRSRSQLVVGGEHHHHLICDDCGKVETFATKSSSVRSIRSRAARGIPLPAMTSCSAVRAQTAPRAQALSEAVRLRANALRVTSA